MSVFDLFKIEKSPYNEVTRNFPDNMRKLGYKVNGHDTIVDTNACVMLEMAKRIERLEKIVEHLSKT